MGDDFVLAQNQVLSKTPGEPLSETEPKSETTAVLSSDTNLSPAPEDFGSSYDSHVPTKQRQECEADTSDANASDSDWDTIDEDTLEETVDDDSASDRTTEDDETSEADSEDENASEWKHFRPTWDEGDDLVAWASDNMDPDSVIPAQFMRAMGKMYQKRGKYEMAESLLRMAQDELDRIAGRLHEYTLDTVFSFAAVLSHLGKLDEAGKLARRAVQGYLKAKGPENATTLRVLGEISRAYSAVCRQLLQHDPPANSEERRQVSRHTDMYISICQEVPLSAVSIMLGGLGSVLALAGHPANANLAFQWKYDRSADLARRWPPGYKEDVYGDEFHSWLRDVAKEVQGINAGLSSSDPFLIGGEETPAEALSTYLMQHVTAELTREFMGISLSGESDPIRVATDSVQTWVQDTINNIPSWDPLFGTSSSTETVLASLTRHVIAKTIQDEDLWNSLAGLWKYNPNYPPNQQEVPSIEGLATRLMAEARPAKETIPRESSPPTTSFVTISDSLYDTLPLNEGGTLIRLLELLPGDTDEPLVCNLVVANMLDTPVYEAVSYTWGIDAGLTQEAAVRVNNIRLQVTPNLHACLIALRYPDASRMLWVDAICINQKDDDEKSEQVARMTTIYSSASHVLVYLGDGDEVDEAFFRRDIFAGLFALCGREWWTRIWIQQEFALSPTDPTFCVGHLRTQALPLIQDVLEILPQTSGMVYEPEMGRWNLSSRLSQRTRQVINCLAIRSWFEEGSKNLNTILSMTPLSKCSDPRDLIFGRYIFMKPMLRAVFKPDYSLTTESLFEMVAIWLLKIEIGMEIFWLYPSRLSSNSPSWVPDFTKPAANFSFSFPPARERGWRAEGQADDPLDIDCGVLKVYARPLDTISHVFRVGYVPVPELVGQVLFLEQSLLMLAEQDPPHLYYPIKNATAPER
ncbi:hypothetical protein BHE90_004613 [Fusarium euwallaceae]|uniref:Heterokaryon incompatibility domain-containing protein n=1 Tax=Fusarium euwallaceae TaxID=1147111 RepID=A0A430LYS1_9HYPO|nr:hypothetical protein BHE90_004613 [Fusarium euwallaceae]